MASDADGTVGGPLSLTVAILSFLDLLGGLSMSGESSSSIEPWISERLVRSIAASSALIGVTLYLISNLWISDDAAITLRSVLNLHHGNGPTFNVGERVQSFSHPLWFALIASVYLVVRNPMLAMFVTSLTCCCATIWIVARPRNLGMLALAPTALLLSSRAFVDYGLSGLENPLSAFLLVLTLVWLRSDEDAPSSDRWRGKWLLAASLLLMTRIDNAPFLIPVIVWVVSRGKRRAEFFDRRSAMYAFLSLSTWVVITVAYYGTFLPNTAMAKLSHDLPRSEVLAQGLVYLAHSTGSDPITTLVIALASVTVARFGSGVHRAAMLGVALHLAYVIWIGGDFMSGRFLSTSFVAAVWVITDLLGSALRARPLTHHLPLLGGALLAVAVLLPSLSPARQDLDERSQQFSQDGSLATNGIVNEKDSYFGSSHPLGQDRRWFGVADWSTSDLTYPREVQVICGGLGWRGLAAGPDVVLLDECALADPFLSRKTPILGEDWRIGHFRRDSQPEYFEYLATGEIDNSGTETFIAEITAVQEFTRGSFFDLGRLMRGLKDSVFPLRLSPAYPNVSLSEFGDFTLLGQPWDANPDGVLDKGALQVRIDPRDDRFPSSISLLLDSNDSYCVDLYFRPVTEVGAGSDETHCLAPVAADGLTVREIEVRKRAALDFLVVRAIDGDDAYAVAAVGLGFDSNP